jgi:hypothetical protein
LFGQKINFIPAADIFDPKSSARKIQLFNQLWEKRDDLYKMSEDEIDKLVMPISGGIKLRYLSEGVRIYSNPQGHQDKNSFSRAIKTGLTRLFQHLQGCCEVCREPTPTNIEKFDEQGNLVSVEVDKEFDRGASMAASHLDHNRLPENGCYIPPKKLDQYDKDVAKEQLLCTGSKCAG